MDTFILTVQLLTRIPLKKEIQVNDRMLSRGVMYWPIVGVIIGAIQASVFFLLALILPKPAAVAIAVFSELCVNGGFHLDGLCDTADAIYSARTKERMLEIMKDSRVGTNGVIAAIFDIALKIIILCQLKDVFAALLLAPVAGKMVQAVFMYKENYARDKGLGHAYIGKISLAVLLCCSLSGLAITGVALVLVGSVWLLWIPAVCFGAAWLFRLYIESKIDGMTGDTLGAGSEVIEILFLILLSIGQTFLLL